MYALFGELCGWNSWRLHQKIHVMKISFFGLIYFCARDSNNAANTRSALAKKFPTNHETTVRRHEKYG